MSKIARSKSLYVLRKRLAYLKRQNSEYGSFRYQEESSLDYLLNVYIPKLEANATKHDTQDSQSLVEP